MKKTMMIVTAAALAMAPVEAARKARAQGHARFLVEMDDGGGFCRKVGETVAVSARVKGKDGDAVNSGTVEAWVDDGWTNVVWRRSVDLAKEPVVKMSLSRSTPGTLRIHLSMAGVREKMDRVVFGQEEIMPLTPYPEDFESYWRGELAKLKREVPIAVEKTPAPDLSTAEHDVFRVSFATFNGKRVYGFLSVPKGKGPFPVCVNVPGAGPGVVAPARTRKGWISFTMNMHGFPIGRTKKEQKERYDAWLADLQARSGEPKYQRFGFAAGRDKPIYHDIVTGMVRALDWLADETYADASRFVYSGCSQGGGFGIYLTSLWGRFRKSLILCPNMCDMLAYKAGRQPGSEHILEQTPKHRPAAELTGPYYDACNFARLIRTPVRMVYGLSDDNCNTGGGIAAFNALGCADKELRLLPGLGHGWYPVGFDKWLFDLESPPSVFRTGM